LTTTYSSGGGGSFIKTESNRAASKCLDTAMFGKLSCDALAVLKKTCAVYTKQGFKKLAALKSVFPDKSMSVLSLRMFKFIRIFFQDDLLPAAYKSPLND
jgi:hypothetical protein